MKPDLFLNGTEFSKGKVMTDRLVVKPYIDPKKTIPELTIAPIIMGIFLGIVFGASSLFLALKVGMTVSASIPVAVLSITLFRYFSKIFGFRQTTILENNIVQTTGSAGESIAFGVAVTMPALLILGYDMDTTRIMVVAVLGGLLGVLMMIPLRHALIVDGHGELKFPEGTACANVLIAGETGGTNAKTVFGGFFVGLIYKILNLGTKLWNDIPSKAISGFKGAEASVEVSPELLGVGYIIGPRIASIMVAGGVLSSFVFIPMIKLFGDGLTAPLFPGTKLISEMAAHDVWRSYILYIGAGAVAAAGIISLIQNLPVIIRGARAGFAGLSNASGKAVAKILRTEQDIPMIYVGLGCLLLIAIITLTPSLHMNVLGALLILVFGFLFVTVSSRLTGEIGSSSNPISGMTVATLLVTSLVFLLLGWVSPHDRITALSVAAIVCIASSNGGTTAQDLKTGHLVGATPKYQQIGILIGALTSALVIGYTLNLLNDASTVYSKKDLPQVVVPSAQQLAEKQSVQDPSYKDDKNSYRVLWIGQTGGEGVLEKVPAGKYLVDDAGKFQYKVDPGINGSLKQRDNGSSVQKYEAPKARLMSLIIDGILSQKLPWGLVLLGAFMALVLELCGISALPFAVGVYLPLSASTPIFAGGALRWIVDFKKRRDGKKESAENEDSGPGVLYASGLIAGGSIAGIGVALLSIYPNFGETLGFGARIPGLAENNVIPVLAFLALMTVLGIVGSKGRPAV